MNVHIEPISNLTSRAKHALIQELGAVDAMRFLNQLRSGSGDYSADREALLKDMSVKDIVEGIKAQRKTVLLRNP